MTIKQQLARIVQILSGSDSTAKNIPGTLGEIADAVENGGGSGGGSNSPLIIEFVASEGESGSIASITTTTTPSEFIAAFNAGRNIYARITEGNIFVPIGAYMHEVNGSVEEHIVAFVSPGHEDEKMEVTLDTHDITTPNTFGVIFMVGGSTIYDYHSSLGS